MKVFLCIFYYHSFMPAKMGSGVKPCFKVCKLKYIFCLRTRVRDTGTDTGNGYGIWVPDTGYGYRCALRNRYTGTQAHRPTDKRQKIGLQGLYQHPTLSFFFGFFFRQLACMLYITQIVYTTNVLYLHMSYKISIHNRIFIGFALGWSYYGKTEEYDYSELTLFLGLLSIVIVRS